MKENLSINLLQVDSVWNDPAQNILNLEHTFIESKSLGNLIILPEMWTTGFIMDPKNNAHFPKDKYLNQIQELASRFEVDILGTYSIHENDAYFNRAVLITKEGDNISYDKQYLFSPSGEGDVYTKGEKANIINYKGWNLKLQICYDLRFPESVRDIPQPDLIIYMANWPTPRILHWQTLLKARAIENQCYVIGCNRIGEDGNGWEFPGSSMVIDYTGGVITQLDNQLLSETIRIDKSKSELYRSKLPFYKDKII